MKLQHSKAWYDKHIEAEGDAEVGAGIPPWSQVGVGPLRQTAPAVTEIQPHANRESRAIQRRRVTRDHAKVLCPA